MLCLTAEAHINNILLCPPRLMAQDTVHLISYQQMDGSLIVPITHLSRIPYQHSRQQMGMGRYSWSEVKLVLQSIRFSVKQIHHRANGTHWSIFS